MAKVRLATAADADALVTMGRAMHAESPHYSRRGWDDRKVRAEIDAFTGGATGRACLFVAEAGGEIVGMAAMFIGEDWFGPGRFVVDRVVYVDPAHRGGTAFARLVVAAEEWAAAAGVEEVTIGVSTGVHVDQTVHAYERLGYRLLPTRVVTKTLPNVHRT